MTNSKEEFIDKAWDVSEGRYQKRAFWPIFMKLPDHRIGLPAAIDSPAMGMFRLILAEGRSFIRWRVRNRNASARSIG